MDELFSANINEDKIYLEISREGGDYKIGYDIEDKGMKIYVQNILDESKEYLGSWKYDNNDVWVKKHILTVSMCKIYKEDGRLMIYFVYADNPRKSRKRPLEDCLK